jgi:hypothetical protein
MFHWLAHLTGQNLGKVVTYRENGYIYVGFECSKCKKIDPKTLEKIEESEIIHDNTRPEPDYDDSD